MKKLIFGMAVMTIGSISTIAMLVSTILSPLNPWTFNGIGGWYGCLLGMGLVVPFAVSLVIAIIGSAIAIWGTFEKKD